MGKGKRLKMERKMKAGALKKTSESIFNGPELEPLTDKLISELHKTQDIPLKDLKDLQKSGAKFVRSTNSFRFPPEIDLS